MIAIKLRIFLGLVVTYALSDGIFFNFLSSFFVKPEQNRYVALAQPNEFERKRLQSKKKCRETCGDRTLCPIHFFFFFQISFELSSWSHSSVDCRLHRFSMQTKR